MVKFCIFVCLLGLKISEGLEGVILKASFTQHAIGRRHFACCDPCEATVRLRLEPHLVKDFRIIVKFS